MSSNQAPQSEGRLLIRDVLRVARGGLIGQAPFVLLSPAITRLYSPSQIGIYGLAMAFVGVAAPVAGLRFELAAISAPESALSRNLLSLSALLSLPVSLLCGAALCALKSAGIASYGSLSWPMVLLTVAAIWSSGIYSAMRCGAVRRYEFRVVANTLSVQGAARATAPLALALLSRGALMLITGEVLARCASIGMLLSKLRLGEALAGFRFRWGVLAATARRYWKYPLLLTPSALIDSLAIAIPIPMVAALYGLSAAGTFALVQRLVMLPASFMVSSVGDVYHAHATRIAAGASADPGGLMRSTAARLALFALAVYVPLALLAPSCAGWVFGREWAQSGILITAMAPACIAQTVVSPLSRGLLVARKEERKLVADVACLFLPSLSLYFASRLPLPGAITAYSIGSVAAFGIYFCVIAWSQRKVAHRSS
ncbi:MAG: lipopolysaccharide biosynthesis protein [Steroidobacteraceae bacterium]